MRRSNLAQMKSSGTQAAFSKPTAVRYKRLRVVPGDLRSHARLRVVSRRQLTNDCGAVEHAQEHGHSSIRPRHSDKPDWQTPPSDDPAQPPPLPAPAARPVAPQPASSLRSK